MIIGLTGGIASGKSSVARLLKARGAVHLDADLLVHELYTDPLFAARVQALFEAPVLHEQGTVDRAALGKIVFEDAKALRQLESLVHPAVQQLRAAKIAENAHAPCIVLEAVKLIEAGHADGCDEIWCVWSQPEIQVQRLMQKRNLTEAEARLRLAHQPSLETKRQLLRQSANEVPFIVIENNGALEELAAKVQEQWEKRQDPKT